MVKPFLKSKRVYKYHITQTMREKFSKSCVNLQQFFILFDYFLPRVN